MALQGVSGDYRLSAIAEIDGKLGEYGNTFGKPASELEKAIYSRSKDKKEYVNNIAKVIYLIKSNAKQNPNSSYITYEFDSSEDKIEFLKRFIKGLQEIIAKETVDSARKKNCVTLCKFIERLDKTRKPEESVLNRCISTVKILFPIIDIRPGHNPSKINSNGLIQPSNDSIQASNQNSDVNKRIINGSNQVTKSSKVLNNSTHVVKNSNVLNGSNHVTENNKVFNGSSQVAGNKNVLNGSNHVTENNKVFNGSSQVAGNNKVYNVSSHVTENNKLMGGPSQVPAEKKKDINDSNQAYVRGDQTRKNINQVFGGNAQNFNVQNHNISNQTSVEIIQAHNSSNQNSNGSKQTYNSLAQISNGNKQLYNGLNQNSKGNNQIYNNSNQILNGSKMIYNGFAQVPTNRENVNKISSQNLNRTNQVSNCSIQSSIIKTSASEEYKQDSNNKNEAFQNSSHFQNESQFFNNSNQLSHGSKRMYNVTGQVSNGLNQASMTYNSGMFKQNGRIPNPQNQFVEKFNNHLNTHGNVMVSNHDDKANMIKYNDTLAKYDFNGQPTNRNFDMNYGCNQVGVRGAIHSRSQTNIERVVQNANMGNMLPSTYSEAFNPSSFNQHFNKYDKTNSNVISGSHSYNQTSSNLSSAQISPTKTFNQQLQPNGLVNSNNNDMNQLRQHNPHKIVNFGNASHVNSPQKNLTYNQQSPYSLNGNVSNLSSAITSNLKRSNVNEGLMGNSSSQVFPSTSDAYFLNTKPNYNTNSVVKPIINQGGSHLSIAQNSSQNYQLSSAGFNTAISNSPVKPDLSMKTITFSNQEYVSPIKRNRAESNNYEQNFIIGSSKQSKDGGMINVVTGGANKVDSVLNAYNVAGSHLKSEPQFKIVSGIPCGTSVKENTVIVSPVKTSNEITYRQNISSYVDGSLTQFKPNVEGVKSTDSYSVTSNFTGEVIDTRVPSDVIASSFGSSSCSNSMQMPEKRKIFHSNYEGTHHHHDASIPNKIVKLPVAVVNGSNGLVKNRQESTSLEFISSSSSTGGPNLDLKSFINSKKENLHESSATNCLSSTNNQSIKSENGNSIPSNPGVDRLIMTAKCIKKFIGLSSGTPNKTIASNINAKIIQKLSYLRSPEIMEYENSNYLDPSDYVKQKFQSFLACSSKNAG